MSIIAVYNIKGGVGKTATAVNLAYLAAAGGERTLLCDMDPQGSSSFYFRVRPHDKFNTEKLLKGGKHIDRAIRATDYPDLHLLPADFSYRNFDIALDDMKKSRQRLGKVLRPLCSDYSRIFLDSPPNITLLSENIFHAADHILVPLIPTTLSCLALQQLYDFLDEIGESRRKVLVFFSMVEKRKKLHLELMQQLIREPGVMPALVPLLADIERMGLYRQPVSVALPHSLAAAAYADLWREVSKRLRRS